MKNGSIYRKTVLENGIRVVTEKIPYVRSVSIGIWILAGTIDETKEKSGLAHFVEHIVFKGTHNRSSLEIAEALESLGGHINAFTGKDLTCYYAQVLDENIDVAIDILSDLILNPKLKLDHIENEKKVVVEEINEVEDSPEDLIHDHFIQALFSPHPLSYSTLGTKETVLSITRDDIQQFLQKNYTGNRIIVAAAGNINHEKIVELSQKYLTKIKSASERTIPQLPEERNFYHKVENSFQQAHICLGRRAMSYSDPNRYAMLLLNTILGVGMSSRLFQNIREKHGFAYSIYSFVDFLKDTGIVGVYLGTDKSKVEKAIDLVLKELKALMDGKISPEELSRRKNQLKGNLLLGMESTSNRMNRLAKTEINYGKFIPIDHITQAIDGVTEDQIFELASIYFQEDKLGTIIFVPKN